MYDYPLKQRTIGHLLADKARRIGDRTWLIFGEQRYSYAQAHDISNRYANGFRELGIRKGDHVAVMMPNCPEFIWTIWGLGKLGAVTVPLNTAARGDLLRYFITQSDSTCVVVAAEWADRVAEALGGEHSVRPSSRSAVPASSRLAASPASIWRLSRRRPPMSPTGTRCWPAIRNTSCTRRARPVRRRA